MVTIRQIAKQCGCSTATVSKALNGAADVSAETAERIRRTASEMGYMPNAAARALKTSRSYNFGVLFEINTSLGLTHEYFGRIINSFKVRAEELGYDLSFISDHLGGREITYAEHARYRNCDGVFIASGEYSDPAMLDLVHSGIPVVTVDYMFDHCGSVQSDNVQGMADLVRHIYALGHRRIALIHGEDNPVTRTRVASFYRTCRELELDIPEEYVLSGIFHNTQTSAILTGRLLELKTPPTCIIYPDDIAALGGLNELERRRLSIPEDISVAGYDGVNLSQIIRPRLTTLHQDAETIGIRAAEELARAVEEGKLYIPGRFLIPGKVIPGGTVKECK